VKITALEVDGYGVWSGLKLDGLSDELNVFFGPNEAGKTTLMQFVRSVLYGFSPQRRQYLPPLRGGRPGGSVLIAGPNGRFQVSRHLDEEDADAPETVTLSAADGTRQGEHLLKVLLCNIDEVIFNNVFAVGLRELQELGTLSDTEAASLLYNLSAGLDRVVLVEVMRELESSRNRLLDSDARPCEVTRLLARREQLRTEIDELGELTRRYARKVAQRDQLQRETTRLEEEGNRLQHQQRVVEIAGAVADRWQQRAELDDQLLALGPAETMPEGALERLDAINARLAKHQDRVDGLKRRREQLRDEAAGLNINEALCRLAPRIEALREQEDWIGTLQTRVAELETEIAELESRAAAEQERFGLGKGTAAEDLPSVSDRALAALRQPARAIRQCRRRVEQTQQELARQRQSAQSLGSQIEAALAAHGEQDLAEAMDSAGSLVGRLRRRTQIGQRLEEMERYQAELEQQSRALLESQVLPVWVLLGLGAVFVVGVVLMMAGLLMPQTIPGSLGWPVALLGLAGTGAAVAAKFMLERSNARRLAACQKQIEMLQGQIRQAKDDRENLDRELPQESGAMGDHLRAAERKLAALEEIVPLDAQRQAARQDAKAAEGRAREAQDRLSAAGRRWREALGGLGLPPALSPKQVRELVTRRQQIDEIRRRLETRYEELQQRHRELDAIIARIAQLAADTDPAVAGEQPVEQLRQLVERLAEQEERLKRRTLLRVQARQIRRKRAKHLAAINRLKQRRRELLREVGAEDEPQFRQRALDYARAQTLRGKRETLKREIDAAIAGYCPEEALRETLETAGETLEARREELKKRLEAVETKLQERYEKRGQFNEQLKALAEDRTPAAKQLELAMVEKQLDEAIGRWQVLAFTSQMLHSIRKTYEHDRQPETLQEASGYLERLTCGRYLRVWTPLGDDVLLVDDAQGNSLPVEVLSQGAREQLFVCLRLALAASYARHGAPLPLVLDDVLVNFDAERAKAAAAVLRDFAAAGHQLLVFTCHEHIQKLFKSLRVPVQRLPSHVETDLAASVPQKRSTKKQPPREPQPEEPPRKIAAASTAARPAETTPSAEDDQTGQEQGARVDDHASWEYDEAEEQEELPVEDESREAYDEEEDEEEEQDACEYDEEEEYDEDEYEEQDEEEDEYEYEEEEDEDDGFREAEAA